MGLPPLPEPITGKFDPKKSKIISLTEIKVKVTMNYGLERPARK